MLVTDKETGPERYEALLVVHVPDGKPRTWSNSLAALTTGPKLYS
jgi:hypothetical protein